MFNGDGGISLADRDREMNPLQYRSGFMFAVEFTAGDGHAKALQF